MSESNPFTVWHGDLKSKDGILVIAQSSKQAALAYAEHEVAAAPEGVDILVRDDDGFVFKVRVITEMKWRVVYVSHLEEGSQQGGGA